MKTVLIVVTLVLAFASHSQAQLNEKKIERDASGIYKGKIAGGSLVYVTEGFGASSPIASPTSSGKFKLPVKDGKASSTLKDTDLPGNDQAACNGTWKKTDVQRGGKKITLQGTGTVNGDDAEGSQWSNGKATGALTEKGPKWNAKTKLGGQRFVASRPDPLDPMNTLPAYTQIVTNLEGEGVQ